MPDHPGYDVAIVGLGPVGSLTALLLAESGLRVVILERSRELFELPRAVGIDGESMRAFQRIGLGEDVDSLTQPSREGERILFANSKLAPLFGIEVPELGPNGWRDIAFFDQPELETYLREQLSKRDRIDVRLGYEVVALRDSASEVVVECREVPEGPGLSVRAAYVIGCDGASSFVRAELGTEWQSLGYDQDWLVIDVLQKSGADLPIDTMQVCDPARLTSYICGKDPNRRWEFALQPGETREEMLSPETIDRLLAPWLAKEDYELRRKAVYQFHAAIAADWRKGRVLLAGDAAHQTPPFLGQGLNAGFRDAVNLGWKLPLVIAGACDESLLDSYQVERGPHAQEVVAKAVSVGKLMETIAAREAGLPDPYPPSDDDPSADPTQLIPALTDGVLLGQQRGKVRSIGRLLRQPVVGRGGEEARRLDEVFGRGFVLVGRTEGDLALGPEASAILERIQAHKVSLEGWEAADGELDDVFEDHPAVVLRPDRIVFGAVDGDWSLDRLVLELGAALALR